MRFHHHGLALAALSVSATAIAQQADTKTRRKKTTIGSPSRSSGVCRRARRRISSCWPRPPTRIAKGVAVATSGSVPNVTYVLSGGTNLAAHVGHRVEITGRTSGDAQKAVSTDSKRHEAGRATGQAGSEG